MSEDLKKERTLSEKLGERYRLVVLDDDSLKEVRSVRLSLLNLYLLISSLLLLFIVVIGSLIAFTPLKRMIPGYGDVEGNMEFLALESQVAELEEIIDAQAIYLDGMKNMVRGEDLSPELKEEITPINLDTASADSVGRVPIPTATKTNIPIAKGIGGHYLASPVRGTISSGFLAENRKNHLGVDIVAPKNSAISAVKDGIVISSDWSLETGHSITIQHDHDLVSVYKHNEKLLKKTGERVSQGEAIAIIGNSGELSSGPHLHFELWYNANPVDPAEYIEF